MSDFQVFPLEERTYLFALQCRDFINNLPKNLANLEYAKQLIRSSGSQASNYIEANEALSKKDFIHRIKICIKETKESALWLKLVRCDQDELLINAQKQLIKESIELRKIFGAIFIKSQSK